MYIHEVKKSKFISYMFTIENKVDLKHHLEGIKKEHKGAKHFCYGWILDPEKEFGSHNGTEPIGTAGKPILKTMQYQKLEYTLIIVVRYYGGIKLGHGGISRAYVTATKEIIAATETENTI